jgi:NADPH-dependent glutamate synthase beta subunit-like oxidoreductase/Pyruvate/2-oxoacid:ferredoxin oxidoreductase delta subunit
MTVGSKYSGDGVEQIIDCVTPSYHPRQVEKQAPCQEGCPNCGDIRHWIGVVAQRTKTGISKEQAFTRAWQTIVDVNPFPSTLGRICPHPCESHCNRSGLDEPLAINAMERFLGDWAVENRLPLARLPDNAGDEWIGVVGAGPSGLSFAYQLARRGYRVTVYEAKEQAGGMLRYGVPDYRLPPAILDAEIARILELGVELKVNTLIGRDITLEELRKRHATLYLGLGAQQGRSLSIEGGDGPSVWTGIDYLSRINCGEKIELGTHVIVIGGGNTAVDAARSARRTGADVTVLYRRSREEMPAIQTEVDDMLEEGVKLILLASPVRLKRDNAGKPKKLVASRMALGEPDSSGRRRPEVIANSEFSLPVDSLITAVSQTPALKGFEALKNNRGWLLTDSHGNVDEDVLAGGDTLSIGIAGNAIVQGRTAAEALHARLRGIKDNGSPVVARARISSQLIKFDSKPKVSAVRSAKLPGDERIANAEAEVVATISELQFLQEVERCFSCGSCMGCEQCSMFCTLACYTKLEEVGPGMYFTLMLDACKACGKCIEVCPCGYLDANPEDPR